jgi:hypothetical protein
MFRTIFLAALLVSSIALGNPPEGKLAAIGVVTSIGHGVDGQPAYFIKAGEGESFILLNNDPKYEGCVKLAAIAFATPKAALKIYSSDGNRTSRVIRCELYKL